MGSSVAKYSPDGWKVIKHGRETGLSGVERAKTITCLLAFLLSTIHSLIICIHPVAKGDWLPVFVLVDVLEIDAPRGERLLGKALESRE